MNGWSSIVVSPKKYTLCFWSDEFTDKCIIAADQFIPHNGWWRVWADVDDPGNAQLVLGVFSLSPQFSYCFPPPLVVISKLFNDVILYWCPQCLTDHGPCWSLLVPAGCCWLCSSVQWYDCCAAVHENPLFPQFCQYKEYNAGPFYKHILLELMVLLAT